MRTFETLLQQSTSLQAAEYFSIVRRRLCCASLLILSTSSSTKTLKPFWPVVSIGRLRAMSCRWSHIVQQLHCTNC